MNTSTVAANPFALMVQPEQVLRAMQTSKSLRCLTQQQFRPLDRENDTPAPEPLGNRLNRTPIEFVPTIFEMDLVLPSRPVRNLMPTHMAAMGPVARFA